MDFIVKDLDNNYKLDAFRNKADKIIFEISSEISTANCPYCGKESKRIHSRYQREIQDLPMQGKKVVLLVSTRKFFCDNDACCKRTFSERHTFADANGKRTKRLEKNILFTSSQLSSINASKVLKNSNVDISKSSICVLLKKMPCFEERSMGIMGDYMNNLMYAMEHSYSEMKIEIDQILKKTDYTTEDENSIFYAVGKCLHAMLDYAERIRSNDLDKDTLDAFKYANNGLKHGIEVETITKPTGGITFPIHFPFVIPVRRIIWKVKWDARSKRQEEMYLKHLDGKDVVSTCGEFIERLKEYSI